jgi:hypothetical protein
MLFAFILIVIGIIFFLKNIGLITINWSVIWPLLVVSFGVYIAIRIHRLSRWKNRIFGKTVKKIDLFKNKE